MNQSQALAKLRKIIGPKLGYQIDPKALDADARAAAIAKGRELAAKLAEVTAARDKRRAELLQDPAYQALKAEAAALEKGRGEALYYANHKRITVGVTNDLFFSVRADGDNWAEVVAKVTEEHAS